MFEDIKHISSEAIVRFASNLKIALRSAYNLVKPPYRQTPVYHRNQHNHGGNQSNFIPNLYGTDQMRQNYDHLHNNRNYRNSRNVTTHDNYVHHTHNDNRNDNYTGSYGIPNNDYRRPVNYNYSSVSFDTGNDSWKWSRSRNYNQVSVV